ncbi:MAG: polysaccharide biosynthesis/export family protein [Candidatus Krumholzibacteriia bacterium]
MNVVHRMQEIRIARMVMAGLALLVVAVTAGCGGSQPPVQSDLVPFTPEQTRIVTQARNAEYRLRPGDRLAVDFKYEDELDSTQLLVLPDGRLSLPGGVDPVLARGLTVTQLDSTLTALYSDDYLRPELSVIVESLAELHVYVFGQVNNPGAVRLPHEAMGLLQAVAEAGGFKNGAAPKETAIMRVTDQGFLLRRIDLSHLERRGIPDFAALDLQPYDVIYVPQSTLGDLKYVSDSLLSSLLDVTRLFWDVYAIGQIDKVTTLYR